MAEPTRITLDTLDVPLPGGRTLRLALHREADGSSELLIAAGFPERSGWAQLMAEGINLPGAALPELAKALEALGRTAHLEGSIGNGILRGKTGPACSRNK